MDRLSRADGEPSESHPRRYISPPPSPHPLPSKTWITGDTRENWDTKTLLLQTARDPATANTFNYASMAHNNHFFFASLSPTPTDMPAELTKALTNSFSSVDTFRSTFLATAASMFGPGFVWLVQDNSSSPSSRTLAASAPPPLRILTTYIAGTPYPGAHQRQQSRDLSTHNLSSAEDHRRQTAVQSGAGAFGRSNSGMDMLDTDGDVRRFGGADVTPLACVNTWEHAWIHDFGVAGKRKYLEAWWNRVDWEEVWARAVKPEDRLSAGSRGGFLRQ